MAEPPIIRRLRIVMSQLTSYARKNGEQRYSRMAWVMQGMFEEVLDELGEVDQTTMEQWFVYFGQIIEWCGSGDESILPPHVRKFLAEHHPQELLAIEAPKQESEASVNA